jgi:CHAD domain-containing protein
MQASDTLAEAGRKVFSFFLARMLYHEAGTRLGEDIEELHDMRVATRRMRAAFDIFGAAFKPQRVKEHLKGLRSTGRALGAVRDWDVFLEKADQDIHHLSAADQENLTFLLEHWRAEREAARRAMIAYLDSPAYLRFVSEFNIFVTTPGKHEEVIKDGSFSGEPVPAVRAMAHLAPVLIYTRLGAVRAFTDLIPHAKIVQLHALRIQFKSLHYILDFLKEILGPQNKNVLAAVKRMQDHLGDLNDAEVACQRLSLLLENWEKNQLDTPLAERRNPESLLAYLSLKHLQRHELLIRFPAAWAEFDTFELRQQLAEALAVL